MAKFFKMFLGLASIGITSLCSRTNAQEASSFPLVSMELRILPEQAVCDLPDGYTSILRGLRCPQISIDVVETLKGQSMRTKPIPPDQEISLERDLSRSLSTYRKGMIDSGGRGLSFGQRKSALFIFDFGESQQKSDLDVSLVATQKGEGCNGLLIKEKKWEYLSTLPAKNRYFLYHNAVDTIIPCASVTWQLTAKDQNSNKIYQWKFKTIR